MPENIKQIDVIRVRFDEVKEHYQILNIYMIKSIY